MMEFSECMSKKLENNMVSVVFLFKKASYLAIFKLQNTERQDFFSDTIYCFHK